MSLKRTLLLNRISDDIVKNLKILRKLEHKGKFIDMAINFASMAKSALQQEVDSLIRQKKDR